MKPDKLSMLTAERDRIEQWQRSNRAKLGGAEYRRMTLTHRLLTDLIERRGGSKQDHAFVLNEMAAIHEGKRDGEEYRSDGAQRWQG